MADSPGAVAGCSFDVAVLGGGPAGAALALKLAQRDVRVAMLERSRYDRARIGEVLSPEAANQLRGLGIWDAFERAGHLPSPGIVAAWADAKWTERDFVCSPYGCGWHLDRRRFDTMLAAAARAAGASLLRGVRVTHCRRSAEGPWRVFVRQGEVQQDFGAHLLVDATGRSSWLAGRLETRRVRYDRLVGVACRVEASGHLDQRLAIEAFAGGWWYTARLPGGRLLAACMTDADLVPRGATPRREFWKSALEQAPRTAEIIGRGGRLGPLRIVAADTAQLTHASGTGWIAVGDASSSFDPLSARGIAKAIRCGVEAADAALEWLAGHRAAFEQYDARLREDFADYRSWQRIYYRQVQRWPATVFWSRRHNAP